MEHSVNRRYYPPHQVTGTIESTCFHKESFPDRNAVPDGA